jgi:hypothetical protein
MCDLFSDVVFLSNLTGVTMEYAYNELLDCDGNMAEAISYCRFNRAN